MPRLHPPRKDHAAGSAVKRSPVHKTQPNRGRRGDLSREVLATATQDLNRGHYDAVIFHRATIAHPGGREETPPTAPQGPAVADIEAVEPVAGNQTVAVLPQDGLVVLRRFVLRVVCQGKATGVRALEK